MGGGIILLYHRVTRLPRDPQLLCVTPENFEQHLQILRRQASLVPLQQMVRDVRRGHVPDGSVAITFDDGYLDNLLEARPLLEKYEVPATVFATTRNMEPQYEFFWDDLDRILLSPGRLNRILRLNLPGGSYERDLGTSAEYDAKATEHYRSWNVLAAKDPTPRHSAYRELCALLHRSTLGHRHAILQSLQNWAGAEPTGRTSHRMMTLSELRELASVSLIDIGGHTIDHPCLAVEDSNSQSHQVTANRQSLGELSSIGGFAYPFGTRHDFTNETIRIVKEAGYTYACANFPGQVLSTTDLYQLPRLLVRDWPAQEFAHRISTVKPEG